MSHCGRKPGYPGPPPRTNGIRIRIFSVRIRKALRFGHEPEAQGLFSVLLWVSGVSLPCPFVPWLFRFSSIAASGPLTLNTARQPGHNPADGFPDRPGLFQEQGLDLFSDQAQRIPEVRPHGGHVVLVTTTVEVAVAAVGQPARHGQQDKGSVYLLTDAALRLRVEVADHILANLVQFLHAPSPVIEVAERLDSIAITVKKRGGEAVFAVTDGVPDQADTEGPALQRSFVSGRVDRDGHVGLVRGDEITEGRISLVFDAEYEVAPTLLMGEGHGEGVIAAVIHDDIVLCAVLKVGESGQPLVLVGE